MIEKTDHGMMEWVQKIAGKTTVSLEPPQPSPSGVGVSVYLFEVMPEPAVRLVRGAEPVTVVLRYLITTWAGSPKEAHQTLSDLMFAALQTPEMELESTPVPHSLWQSFGLAVRPSFVVRQRVLQSRPKKSAPKVTERIVLRNSPMQPLRGQVLGPGKIGIMNALVEVPALRLSTNTDYEGRFCFAAVPTQPPIQLLRVHAKGREVNVTPKQRLSREEPLIIELNESEI